ncbi:MAG: ParB/RepB/Spo0J family partition protein [Spirochaetaceae bacterium]|jgi:ParB family chromosome partitioning protein|nr:ParB/RepB/Spo0J family partition protein [Spirochaetaceae bacterium]
MAKKFGLGKGLDALLPLVDVEKAEAPRGGGEILIPLEKISPNPGQPRKFFDETALEELASSIREHGVLQPVIVEEGPDGGYTIIAGERRVRAAKLAGMRDVPALIRSYTDEKRLTVSIIENIQRADLNPIEEAAAYKSLIDLTGLSQDEAALRLGKKRSTLANALRLLKLPPSMQRALISAEISAGHARAILSLNSAEDRDKLFLRIVNEHLNVRQAEKIAGIISGGDAADVALAEFTEAGGANENGAFDAEKDPAAKTLVNDTLSGEGSREEETPKRDPNLSAMEERFIETLGTKVKIDGDFSSGVIKIDYFSADDLDRLYDIFLNGK